MGINLAGQAAIDGARLAVESLSKLTPTGRASDLPSCVRSWKRRSVGKWKKRLAITSNCCNRSRLARGLMFRNVGEPPATMQAIKTHLIHRDSTL